MQMLYATNANAIISKLKNLRNLRKVCNTLEKKVAPQSFFFQNYRLQKVGYLNA